MRKKALVIGFSVTGVAAARYLSDECDVYLTEGNPKKEEDAQKIKELEEIGVKLEFGSHSDEFIQNADFAKISPSIPRDAEILMKKILNIFQI